jgi:hypothetical protein
MDDSVYISNKPPAGFELACLKRLNTPRYNQLSYILSIYY